MTVHSWLRPLFALCSQATRSPGLDAPVPHRAAATPPAASLNAGDRQTRYAQFESLDPLLVADVGQTIRLSPAPKQPALP